MKRTIILDSTQISDFLTCPMLWHLRHEEHLASKHGQSEPIRAGSFGHILLEHYYKNTVTQTSKAEAARLAIAHANSVAVEFNLQTDLYKLIINRFNMYWMRWSALRDITPNADDSGPLVERGFSYLLHEDQDIIFVLEGKIDVIGQYAGQPVFMDHKFQFRRRDLFRKRIQFRNYALVTGLTTGVINYIRLTKEISDTTFSRDVVTLMANEHEWWKSELINIFTQVALARGFGDYLRNWDSCEGKFGYPCDFTTSDGRLGICESMHDEQLVKYIKENQYITIQESERWKPW